MTALKQIFAWIARMSKYPWEDFMPIGWQYVETESDEIK